MQLINDRKFVNGFMLHHVDALITREPIKIINYMNTVKHQPTWKLAQWCCKHNLANGKELITIDNAYLYQDGSKTLKVYPYTGEIHLELLASNEYTTPRIDGEGWPHILIEQEFSKKVKVKDLQKAVIDIEFVVTKFIDYMKDTKTNLHTAQFQWFFAIADKNPDSKGYGDFLWFGLSFVDYPRYNFPPAYEAQDGGKEENTGKFIYIIDSKEYLQKPFEVNKKVRVHYDFLPHLQKAINKAKEKGYLVNSDIHDLVIDNMNLGWEVTGTFDVGVNIFNISCEVNK